MSHTTPEDKFHFIVGIEVLLGTSTVEVRGTMGIQRVKNFHCPKCQLKKLKRKLWADL